MVVGEREDLPEWILRDDNEPAWALWSTCQTQWRVGVGGPVGLDYCAVEAVMRMQCIERRRRAPLLDDLRVIEATVLAQWAKERDQ